MAAAGVPVVALLAIAATELASLSAEKGRMQDAADAVALDGANQLSFSTPESTLARVEQSARRQLADLEPRTTLDIHAEIVESGSGVKLTIGGTRLSFFGNLLPPGGFKTLVDSTAVTMNTAPLCVVVLDAEADLRVRNASKVDAGECLVHSNGDVETSDGAQLRAYAIQAGGSASGAGITPQAETGAKTIADPFTTLAVPAPSGCLDTDKMFTKLGSAPLHPGRHCGHLDVEGTTVKLLPGVHVFDGEVQLRAGAKLVGDSVLVVFEEHAKFTVDDPTVRIDLQGLKTGAKAMNGFVFAAAPGRTETVELPAAHVERLEGVVYAPRAKVLIRDGDSGISAAASSLLALAERSKWTVIVSKEIEVTDGADIVVNSDYLSSSVPVPPGVGDTRGRDTRLLK